MVARYRTSMFLYGCPDQDETKWGNLFQIHSTKLRRTLFIKKIFPGTFAVYIVCNGIVTFSLSLKINDRSSEFELQTETFSYYNPELWT